jgi:predicted dehydrogenase
VRILFCGLGGIGQRHLRNLRALLGDQLEAHAYRVRGNRQRLLDNLTVVSDSDLETHYQLVTHTDLGEALANGPAAVFICNPSSLHTTVALAAAREGAHIFIEKPVSDSLEGLDELLSIVESKNLVCYVGYNFRFHPGLCLLKEWIDARRFGNILTSRLEIGEYLPNWHKYEDYRQMYAARAELGGGVILSQIHEMDLICWFFGMPRTIHCRGGKLSDLDINVEDTASSLMQYSGPHGRFPIALHQDFLQRPPARTLKVVGDRAIGEIDLIQNTLKICDQQTETLDVTQFPEFTRNDMFLQQSAHFLQCITSKSTAPKVDLRVGIQSLRLALAARESLVKGVEIELE